MTEEPSNNKIKTPIIGMNFSYTNRNKYMNVIRYNFNGFN